MSARRLLVVDDDPDVLGLVRDAFRGSDVEVEGASSAEQALGKIGSGEPPDTILLDVRLPSMTGLEMCRLLRERGIGVPVILTSSHTSMDLTIEAMQEGAYDYVDKPLRPTHLVPLVEEAMGRTDGGPATREPAQAEPGPSGEMVGRSPAMLRVYKTIGRVAGTDSTVLVTGESGTGKELVARVIHRRSRREDEPFVAVNCAAIPENLLESELFGHEEGAFTGASQARPGTFEAAGRGTLFLDEVAEIPPGLQPKLLRVLEEREVTRLGSTATSPVEARLVAATNRDPEAAVAEGTLRSDLYYRLAIVRIRMPPLREREGDVRRLVDHFVERLGPTVGRRVEEVAEETYERLEAYPWPGNVRELRNVVERSLILGNGATLHPEDVPELDAPRVARTDPGPADPRLADLSAREASLEEVERLYIASVLQRTGGNVTRAAEILGIHRSTLHRKVRDYDVDVPG